MDPTIRLARLSDGMKSAEERMNKWDILTEEQRIDHRKEMKFLFLQFLLAGREIESFFAMAKA